MWPYIVTNFYVIKPTYALISQFFLAKNEPVHVSGSSSARNVYRFIFSNTHKKKEISAYVGFIINKLTD
jgi:hypothetical protein